MTLVQFASGMIHLFATVGIMCLPIIFYFMTHKERSK